MTELMVEEKSRLSVLVIEDNEHFGGNAGLVCQRDSRVRCFSVIGDLQRAKEIFGLKMKSKAPFDVILSDVHVPEREGEEPRPIISEILDICRSSGTPVCFVTRADHHGMLELGDEGFVSLKATTQGRALKTQMELGEKADAAELFRKLKTTESRIIRSDGKGAEVWEAALQMAMNARAKPTPLGMAVRKVGKLGLEVTSHNGMPRIVPKR